LKNLLNVEFESWRPEEQGPLENPPAPGDFVLPEVLAARVRDSAELYSITEIRGCLGEIAQLGPSGRRLASHLQEMADRYDMNAILRFLDAAGNAQPAAKS
jgi:hypothetical protein